MQSTAGVADVVSLMDHYSLTRDDWDGIVELSQFPGRTEVVSLIPSKVKPSPSPSPRVCSICFHIWCVVCGEIVKSKITDVL